jgi:hypothetical protein
MEEEWRSTQLVVNGYAKPGGQAQNRCRRFPYTKLRTLAGVFLIHKGYEKNNYQRFLYAFLWDSRRMGTVAGYDAGYPGY